MKGSKGANTILVVALIQLLLVLTLIGSAIYGVLLAFSASVLVGVIFMFIPPMFMISGLVMLLSGNNVPQMIVELFK